MISVDSARALAGTGLVWEPARGDRFVIPDRGMDEDVFVLSDMTIEAQDHASGRVLGFNGTTEWALDSVAAEDVLWLPGEGALRALLGPALVALEPAGLAGWSVSVMVAGREEPQRLVHRDAEEAYALALLTVRASRAVDLLPLVGHAVAEAVRRVEAAGPAAWQEQVGDGRTRGRVLEDLVAVLRGARALAAGADERQAGDQVRLVADVDPVAEDRVGTLARAVAPVLREVGPDSAQEVLVTLVLAAGALGARLPPVCLRTAAAVARAGAGRAHDAETIEAMATA